MTVENGRSNTTTLKVLIAGASLLTCGALTACDPDDFPEVKYVETTQTCQPLNPGSWQTPVIEAAEQDMVMHLSYDHIAQRLGLVSVDDAKMGSIGSVICEQGYRFDTVNSEVGVLLSVPGKGERCVGVRVQPGLIDVTQRDKLYKEILAVCPPPKA